MQQWFKPILGVRQYHQLLVTAADLLEQRVPHPTATLAETCFQGQPTPLNPARYWPPNRAFRGQRVPRPTATLAETCFQGQPTPLNPARIKIQDRDFHPSDVNARGLTVPDAL
ncbi:hypothetical protein LZY01_12960 [Levilactobacillus zymae]|uniref:Uncharacterized protein n=1 Tax=Levilactobacillus zymae TaxID=267363 RepID=A0ABQ0WX63_9LACO|nr:hypothetical protein LZY01_12960 [Levilactobacillus zymae]